MRGSNHGKGGRFDAQASLLSPEEGAMAGDVARGVAGPKLPGGDDGEREEKPGAALRLRSGVWGFCQPLGSSVLEVAKKARARHSGWMGSVLQHKNRCSCGLCARHRCTYTGRIKDSGAW